MSIGNSLSAFGYKNQRGSRTATRPLSLLTAIYGTFLAELTLENSFNRLLFNFFSPVIILLVVSGCDFVYGIDSRGVITNAAPDEACIIEALRNTPGVVDVTEHIQKYEGWTIAGNGSVHGSDIHYFNYRVGSAPLQIATLMVEDIGEKKFRYSSYMMTMNEKIPAEQILTSLPIIKDSTKRVSSSCNLQIDSELDYKCIGYECR